MSYSKIAPKEYAKLRTQPEHIRQEYEQRANRILQEQVEKERKHLQQQVDEYKEYANEEIKKAYAQAGHWQVQCEIIYNLMAESEQAIKEEREIYQSEIEKLQQEIKKLKADKLNKAKVKKKLLGAAMSGEVW